MTERSSRADFSPLGDHAVTITLGDSIDEATNRRVRAISAALDSRGVAGVVDQVPAFASLVVHYDPERVGGDPAEPPYERFVNALTDLLAHVGERVGVLVDRAGFHQGLVRQPGDIRTLRVLELGPPGFERRNGRKIVEHELRNERTLFPIA